MRKRSLREIVCYAGFKRVEYEAVESRIRRKNLNLLRRASLLGALLCVLLSLLSLRLGTISDYTLVYLGTGVLMGATYLLARFLGPSRAKLVLPLYYVFLVIAFAFSMVIGAGKPDTTATTFDVLLFALPLLIIDRPWRLSLLILGSSVSFAVLCTLTKSPAVAALDRLNVLSFSLLSIAVNYPVLQSKISDLHNQRLIERERDTDGLTRLMTKAAAQRETRAYIASQSDSAALIMIDIDNFKDINDQLGHAYGDVVIRTMGECILSTFRKEDVLARFGGDEFVLFLPHLSDPALISARLDALVKDVTGRLYAPESAVKVTGSIGVAVWPRDAVTYDDLLRRADEALYQSKAKGKNCYTFYFDAQCDPAEKRD